MEGRKNGRGARAVEARTLCVHCNVHEIAGGIGMLFGGAQRRRKRAKNLQVLPQIKNCSSLRYPSPYVVASWVLGCQGLLIGKAKPWKFPSVTMRLENTGTAKD